MKKIIKKSLVLLICCLAITALVGCKKNKKNSDELSRVTVDINPSVELLVDGNNKVVSVTALNDDANVILVGEEVVGKSCEDAVQLIISVATDTGYIVKGEVEASDNTVTISVSGDTKAAEALYNSVKAKVEAYLSSEHVQAVVEKGKALELEALKSLALKADPTLTVEEVNAMTEQQLYNVLKIARLDTALIYSEKLEEMYLQAKEYEVSFVEKEETKKVINTLDTTYQAIKTNYSSLVESFGSSIDAIEKAEYDYLVDPNSDYQKGLAELLNAKKALLEQKAKVAELDEGIEKEAAKIILNLKEVTYQTAYQTAEGCYQIAKAAIDALVKTLRSIEQQLKEVEANLPVEIKSSLTNKATEIESKCNTVKNTFFAKFEAEHAEDIAYYKQQMIDQKAALKAANK